MSNVEFDVLNVHTESTTVSDLLQTFLNLTFFEPPMQMPEQCCK